MEQAIVHLRKSDQRLCKVIDYLGDIHINEYKDPFLFIVGEIVGQMLSNRVRKVLFSRLESLCDDRITPEAILEHCIEDIKGIGISAQKASYIMNLAESVRTGDIIFEQYQELDDKDVIIQLKKVKGIGDWTAKMFLIFFLKRKDILPYEDGAFLQAYKWLYNTKNTKPESITRKCRKWKPYTSIGARYMYKALDTGLTRIPIDEFLNY